MQQTTLLYLHKPSEKKILLAMKKRRFGEGKWNGVGGKLMEGETIKQALVRETFEEIGVKINEDDLVQVATLEFLYKDKPEWDQESHVFFIEKWNGEPIETEEMIPKWFLIKDLPYDKMWLDDPYWLPNILEGKKVRGVISLNNEGDKIIDIKINEI